MIDEYPRYASVPVHDEDITSEPIGNGACQAYGITIDGNIQIHDRPTQIGIAHGAAN